MNQKIPTNKKDTPVILLDACALISLSCKVPAALQSPHSAYVQDKLFLDMLLPLSSAGLCVQIVEMVAFEASQTVSSYKNTLTLFRGNASYNIISRMIHRWLDDNREHAPIVPLSGNDKSTANQLMIQARQALKNPRNEKARDIIMNVQATKKKHPDLGEIASIALGKIYLQQGIKVYFVTTDENAAIKAMTAGLHVLSERQFIYSLMSTEILKRSGIPATAMSDVINALREGRPGRVLDMRKCINDDCNIGYNGNDLIAHIRANLRLQTSPLINGGTDAGVNSEVGSTTADTTAKRPKQLRLTAAEKFEKRYG